MERPASGMDFLKEEDGEKLVNGNGVASGHDVGVRDAAPSPIATNGAVTNGTGTGVAVEESEKLDSINGRAILERINFDN